MKLLTKAVRRALRDYYASADEHDPLVVAKFFLPGSDWTWYACDGGPVDADGVNCSESGQPEADFFCFGLVDGQFAELGSWAMSELDTVRSKFGLGVERDRYWTPVPLSRVMKGEVR